MKAHLSVETNGLVILHVNVQIDERMTHLSCPTNDSGQKIGSCASTLLIVTNTEQHQIETSFAAHVVEQSTGDGTDLMLIVDTEGVMDRLNHLYEILVGIEWGEQRIENSKNILQGKLKIVVHLKMRRTMMDMSAHH